ncbi:MAG: Zn-ribbon domain-containing OB-fold protein [Acidimicrobiia bacterium]
MPTPLTQPFWDAAARRELSVQRCRACATHLFYPRYLCTTCGSDDLEWVTVSGRATVFTYTIARRPTHPGFDDLVPYVIAVVELDEGPKLTTNIVDADLGQLAIGMRVVATFDDVDGVTLVDFRPA